MIKRIFKTFRLIITYNMTSFTKFESFNDFDNKSHQYLSDNKITNEEYDKYKLSCLEQLMNSYDFTLRSDANQIAFMIWFKRQNMILLLNNKSLDKLFDLKLIKNEILNNSPSLTSGEFYGLTPLGGWTMRSSDSLNYYNVLKFIGQFTNDQKTYDICLDILIKLQRRMNNKKLDGPILDYRDIMYLMNFNSNVNTSNNLIKKRYDYGDNYDQFFDSIYLPDPSDERQYEKYKNDIQIILYKNALTNKLSKLSIIHFIDTIVHQHYHVIDGIEKMKWLIKIKVDDEFFNEVKNVLMYIGNTKITNDKKEDMKNDNIEFRLKFIDPNDEKCTDLSSIRIKAICYVSDENYDKEVYNRDMLIALYEKNIVNPNSKFSHNLLREAVDRGILWLTKFLIKHNVPTKDLPKYGYWGHELESKQLSDILKEPKKDYHNYGKEYMNKLNANREKVKQYLIENNHI